MPNPFCYKIVLGAEAEAAGKCSFKKKRPMLLVAHPPVNTLINT